MDNNDEYPFISGIKDVFTRSTIADLVKNHTKLFNSYKKWMIFSDYYFDEQKPNYCVTFSFLPYYQSFEELINLIHLLEPMDIKKAQTISDGFVGFLKTAPIINFTFVMNKNNYFGFLNKDTFVRTINANVQNLIIKCDQWKTKETEEHYNQLKKDLIAMKLDIDNDKKIKIMSQMVFITMVGAYITSELNKFINFELVGWFSDRDKINDLYSNISINFFHLFLYEYSKRGDIKFVAGLADCKATEWYKDLTRISDYITGTFADYNMEENLISHHKFGEVIEKYIVDNENGCFIFKINFLDDRYDCSRVVIKKE